MTLPRTYPIDQASLMLVLPCSQMAGMGMLTYLNAALHMYGWSEHQRLNLAADNHDPDQLKLTFNAGDTKVTTIHIKLLLSILKSHFGDKIECFDNVKGEGAPTMFRLNSRDKLMMVAPCPIG